MDHLLSSSTGEVQDDEVEVGLSDFPSEEHKNPGDATGEMVESLVLMGFNQEEAQNALRISKNDLDMACEYLLNSENQNSV
jgi:Holliday junction resolvasome RuvABC DNA-binding subunit